VEDGLSQSTVWNIFEDSKGFIWFCTPDGLNKFDGYSFTVYRQVKGDINSIQSNQPVFIFEDSQGDLWIDHRGGLSKYHYRQDRFSLVYQIPGFDFLDDGLLPLCESQGKIWTWDRSRGIVGFNRETLKEETIHPAPEKYVKEIRAASRFGKTIGTKAFIGSTEGLIIVFDFNTLQYTCLFNKIADPTYNGIPGASKFAIDSLNNLWIGGSEGIIFLNTKTLSSLEYKRGFEGVNFTSCALDDQGSLWAGSVTQGIFVMNMETGTVKNIAKKNHQEKGLLYNYIESLFKDSSGNIWIGTNGYGVQKFSRHKNKFDHFDLKIGTNTFGANLVKSIAEDERGNLYVGTFGNGLYVIQPSGDISNFKVPVKNNAIGLNISHENDVLLSNSTELFTLRQNVVTPAILRIKNQPKGILFLAPGAPGEVLMATDIGAFRVKKKSSQYQPLNHWLDGIMATVIYRDSRERIWIGAQRSFYQLNKNDSVPLIQERITENYVKSFYEDEKGNIWIASLGDLIKFNPETQEAEYFNEKNGFVNTFFYGALGGKDNKIWISSNKGLASLDPEKKTVKNYSVADGLQSDEFNTGAFYKLKDGRLIFGGLNGFNVFDPTAIQENPIVPKLAFTNFMVDDKPYQLDTAIVYKKQINLDYSQNTFSFEFAGLEYTSPESNQYAYMLKGHDKDWVMAGNRRFVRYSRLAPGPYEFMVKASNSDGIWNETPARVVINILPPIYMKAWFILMLVGVAIVVIILVSVWVVRMRYRAKLRQLEVNHKIQLERERISRDLHDHVGSQLTYIINQLDGGHLEVKEHLSDAREAARLTIGNLRETIWALHREAITLVDFTDQVKEFAMKQLKSKRGMQLNFNENLGTDYAFNPSMALNLFRIAQEVINNAIKHSEGSLLSIIVERLNGSLKLVISDNGKGFPISQTGQNRYGLQNIAFRAKEIDAELAMTSTPATGTQVTISLALSSN
jgi:signal transduction histidine kinase/ligand-binding sensor domain-containing protein